MNAFDQLVDRLHTAHLRARTRRFNRTRSLTLYTAFPKSASGFLLRLLCEASGYQPRRTKSFPGFGHNVMSEKLFYRFLNRESIFYGHIPFNLQTRTLIGPFRKKIVVSLRPLPDVVVSIVDHIRKHGYGPLDSRVGSFPECLPDYFDLQLSSQVSYVIDYIIPWYFQFLVSWIEESRHSPVMWLTFDDIIQDPRSTTKRVTEFCGLPFHPEKLDRFLEAEKKVNFNEGITGRGFYMLDDRALARLNNLASYHRDFLHTNLLDYLLKGGALTSKAMTTKRPGS